MDYYCWPCLRHRNRVEYIDRHKYWGGERESVRRKSRSGQRMLRLDEDDPLWYAIFGQRNVEEALVLVTRVARAKRQQNRTSKRFCRRREKKRRLRTVNRHHMIPVSRGGRSETPNLLRMRIPRHVALHKWAGNATWEEIVAFLEAWARNRQRWRALAA